MATAQHGLFEDAAVENSEYLKQQLITYIGNKRALLPFIETGLRQVKRHLGIDQVSFLDLFSGTGVVARMARKHAFLIHCNDLELYSQITNQCYQANESDIDRFGLVGESVRLKAAVDADRAPGIIAQLYAPQDDNNILFGERVFYTRRNAIFLDAFCRAIADTPDHLRPFLLAPILSQASMYTNTSGVFKGFYKDKQGIGQFGGTLQNALSRILRNIEVVLPVLSDISCRSFVHRQNANDLVKNIEPVDIAYFDPPYNQHPYGSNYFMLNILCDYRWPANISKVSGIPAAWNRSLYNKSRYAGNALFDAVQNVRARYVLISYNSEGFIDQDRFLGELSRIGEVSMMDTRYNTFRGCRNLADRDTYVTENLYLVDKR